MDIDYLILGGGLAGGLTALALAARRPQARVVLVEQGNVLGGNHTWSFHDSDVSGDARRWVEPLIAHHWSGHRVRFPDPDGERRLDGGYASITTARFDRVLRARLAEVGFHLRLGEAAVGIGPNTVRLAGGTEIRAAVVLDARGIAPGSRLPGPCGYQKFLGLEVELAADAPGSAFAMPLLMDATVPQHDGFRFVYVLPLGPRRLLVEDTYYSGSPELDRALLRARVREYLKERGAAIAGVLREETGVLPLPLVKFGQAPGQGSAASPLVVGYRGGWFHPLTGYSLPAAVQVAEAVAGAPAPSDVAAALARLWLRLQSQARFCRWLARALFGAVAPHARWRLLARFYRLPEPTIARFYALELTWRDRLRILAGASQRRLAGRSLPVTTEAA